MLIEVTDVMVSFDWGPLADAIDHTWITALTHAAERQTIGVINVCLIKA